MKHDIIHQVFITQCDGLYTIELSRNRKNLRLCPESFIMAKHVQYREEELILAKRHPDGREFLISSKSIKDALACCKDGESVDLLDKCFSADEIVFDEMLHGKNKERAYLYARNGDEYQLILPDSLSRVCAIDINAGPKEKQQDKRKNLKMALYRYCCGMFVAEETDDMLNLDSGKVRPMVVVVKEKDDMLNVDSLNEEKIIPEYIPVWNAFVKCDFNLEKLMSTKGYEQIEDEEAWMEVLMDVCFPEIQQPISKFMIDWLNGYLDFFERDPELRWKDGSIITDTEILRRLYYCCDEEDIWQLMAQGIGDIEALYLWYMGVNPAPSLEEAVGIPCYCEKDEEKAERMLRFVIESADAIDSARTEATRLYKARKLKAYLRNSYGMND